MDTNRGEMAKQFVKVTLSVVTMMILLLATQKMQILTECIVQNMKSENGHRSSEPIVAPNCKELRVNETVPFTVILCDRNLTLYLNNELLYKYVIIGKWEWPIPGKCLHESSDKELCLSEDFLHITVNGIRLSELETTLLYIFVGNYLM